MERKNINGTLYTDLSKVIYMAVEQFDHKISEDTVRPSYKVNAVTVDGLTIELFTDVKTPNEDACISWVFNNWRDAKKDKRIKIDKDLNGITIIIDTDYVNSVELLKSVDVNQKEQFQIFGILSNKQELLLFQDLSSGKDLAAKKWIADYWLKR